MMRPGRLANDRTCWSAPAGSPGLVLLLGFALLVACTSSKESDAKAGAGAVATHAPTKTKPLNPKVVPTAQLADLEGIDLQTQAPCSKTIENLRPALGGLAELRLALEAATDTASAVALLQGASVALVKQTAPLAEPSESDELRRLRAELVATLKDLSEGLEQAGIAIASDDESAADANLHRIKNGVSNTRTTIHALIEQCAHL